MESPDWLEDIWHGVPLALRPAYLIGEPNHPIPLYKGSLEIDQNGTVEQGSGTIRFVWFPYPCVEFELSRHNSRIGVGKASLKLPEHGSSVGANISKVAEIADQTGNYPKQISGRSWEPITIGLGQDLAHIQFHLTNFHKFISSCKSVFIQDSRKTGIERVVFEAEGWRVTVDQLETIEEIENSLRTHGGYAITHVGKLERSDGNAFAAEDARSCLEALSYFLSFARGFRVAPALLVGQDAQGKQVWQEWSISNADSWNVVDSWFPRHDPEGFFKSFPGFLHWWQDWGEPAKLAVSWYLESNQNAGGVEGSIILTQAGLELLAWVGLVEKGNVPETDFKDPNNSNYNSTSRKINCLLQKLSIPRNLSSCLTNLVQFENQLQHSNNNGPYAFTEIRNSITHSAPENRKMFFKTSNSARVEAWELGLWYLELILLHLFDYQKSYVNRLQKELKYPGNTESVPWI